MDVGSIIDYKQAQLLNAVSLVMTKKTMDTAEQSAMALTDMLKTTGTPPNFSGGYEGRA